MISPLVSVIIPIYKTEKYLEKCVRSVMNQTYTNLEILLIDDGSPDNCAEICDKLASEDHRITVVHKKNGGVASARNLGLKLASGDYLFFVDSDDLVFSQTIKLMIEMAIKYDIDMVCSKCISINDKNLFIDRILPDVQIKIMTKDKAMRYYASLEWAPWNRLIKSKIHKDVFFPDYHIHEDEAIKFKLIWKCECVAELNTATYCYRKRSGSITSLESNVSRIDMFYSRRDNYLWLNSNCPKYKKYFIGSLWRAALYNIGVLCRNKKIRCKEFSDILLFSKQHFWNILLGLNLTPQERLRLLLFVISDWNNSDNLYCHFYQLIGRT